MLNEEGALDRTFQALADPTRRAILIQLAKGERSVGELAEPFAISQPAISRHLRVLEQAELITRQRKRQQQICRLKPEGMESAARWIARNRKLWEERFRVLDSVLEKAMAARPDAAHKQVRKKSPSRESQKVKGRKK